MSRSVAVKIKDHHIMKLEMMGVSVSSLCNALLEWWLDDYEKNIGQLLIIEDIERRIGKLNGEIAEMESKKSLVADLSKELEVRKAEYKDSNNKVLLWHLKSILNKKSVAYQYNIEELKQKQGELISNIYDLDRYFNLEKHVMEFKKLRESTMF